MRKLITLLTSVLTCNIACLAWGHPQHGLPHVHGVEGGLANGLLHPVLGFDHLLAMLAIGLLATQFEVRLRWLIPSCFVGGLLLGGVLGMTGIEVGYASVGIAVSLISLGCALAVRKRVQLVGMLLAAVAFGTAHGFGHGLEMTTMASPAFYGVGFVLTTVLLHLAGYALGQWANSTAVGNTSLRWTGVAVAVVGMILLATMN